MAVASSAELEGREVALRAPQDTSRVEAFGTRERGPPETYPPATGRGVSKKWVTIDNRNV